jgi:4-amino-4-deoxy-L-arabinose transferase-like glycosyltransferase
MGLNPGTDSRDRVMSYLHLLVAFAAVVACAFGIREAGLLEQHLWQEPWQSLTLGLAVAFALLVMQFVARRTRVAVSAVFMGAIVVTCIVVAGIGPSAATALLVLSAYCIGRRWISAPFESELGLLLLSLLQVALGLAALAMVVFALAFTPFNSPLVYVLVLLAPVIVGWRQHLHGLKSVFSEWTPSADPGAAWENIAVLLVMVSVAIRLLAVLHPEIGSDALSAHLVVMGRLRETGTFHFDVTQSIWAVMPMAGDWVMALPYMLSDEAGARLANFLADIALVAMVFQGAKLLAGRKAAAIATLVYSSMPLLYRESSTVYIENFWTLWLCAGLVFGLLTLRSDARRPLIASAFLVGVAFSTKIITLFYFLSFFGLIAIAWFTTDHRQAVRKLLIAAGVIALVAAWPYVNALIRTGNPVFPFMNQIFGSVYYPSDAAFDNPLYSSGSSWRTIYDATFHSTRYLEGRDGSFGVLWFLFSFTTLVALVRERWLLRWAVLGSILFVVGVFHFQSYLRYIMPALPVLAVAVGVVVANLVRLSALQRYTLLPMLLVGAIVNLYLTVSSTWQYAELSLPPINGSQGWFDYRHKRLPETFATDVLNTFNAKRVLWVGAPSIAGARADVFVTNWHGYNVGKQVAALKSGRELDQWLSANRIDHLVIASTPGNIPVPLRELVGRGTTLLGSAGEVQVFRIKDEILFSQELLANPEFEPDVPGWAGVSLEPVEPGLARVTAAHPLQQTVPVTANQKYLLEVQAECGVETAPYRLQVNWQGKDGMLAPTIEVRQCRPEAPPESMIVTAPADAVAASIFATGHSPDQPVNLDRVSFRK